MEDKNGQHTFAIDGEFIGLNFGRMSIGQVPAFDGGWRCRELGRDVQDQWFKRKAEAFIRKWSFQNCLHIDLGLSWQELGQPAETKTKQPLAEPIHRVCFGYVVGQNE